MELKNKRILVLGGTGSLGQALINRQSKENQLIVVSRDEAKHWTIRNRLSSDQHVDFRVADIRDHDRIMNIIRDLDPQIIILAAALKQVDTCERSPHESIQTNLIGIQNVVNAVLELESVCKSLETVLMVSTDKACAPTNVYGMSKAISERVVTSSISRTGRVKFVGVRYGNVLESRGSIIPLFKYQTQIGTKLTVTHESMTRFIMTLDQSIDLIEHTICLGKSSEIWLPKLRSMRIMDLAEIFASKFGAGIEITGIRPGEKMHEELISETESIRVKEEAQYFCLLSSLSQMPVVERTFSYSSNHVIMEISELQSYLESINVLDMELSDFPGREINEISIKKRDA